MHRCVSHRPRACPGLLSTSMLKPRCSDAPCTPLPLPPESRAQVPLLEQDWLLPQPLPSRTRTWTTLTWGDSHPGPSPSVSPAALRSSFPIMRRLCLLAGHLGGSSGTFTVSCYLNHKTLGGWRGQGSWPPHTPMTIVLPAAPAGKALTSASPRQEGSPSSNRDVRIFYFLRFRD